jgi:DNA-binding transcriptional MerR regulator
MKERAMSDEQERAASAEEPGKRRRRATIDRARYPYRMKDLCEQTGLDRQTIHFYIQQGLVPEGQKTGRNMAYYGPEHVERLTLVRRLQTERFLPLKAIRALLADEERGEGFTGPQRAFLAEVKRRLAPALSGRGAEDEVVELAPLLATHRVSRRECAAFEALGLLSSLRVDGREHIPGRDVWVLEFWGALRQLGVIDALGLTVADLEIYEQAATTMFERERQLLLPRLLELPPARAAEFVERALPLIDTFMTRYHKVLVRNFLAALT